MDLGWGLTRETKLFHNSFFYALILHSNLRLDSVYGIKKPEPMTRVFLVERSIELSNLIHSGLEQIEVQFFEEILVENGDG
jgi:hypothetical protein